MKRFVLGFVCGAVTLWIGLAIYGARQDQDDWSER